MQDLTRLIYGSRISPAAAGNIDRTVADILAASRANNSRMGVTGMLLVHDGWFVQALEGPRLAVEVIFKKVSTDRRHASVYVMERKAADERLFAQWAMCAKRLSRADDEVLDVLAMRQTFNPHLMLGAEALRLLTTIQSIHARAA